MKLHFIKRFTTFILSLALIFFFSLSVSVLHALEDQIAPQPRKILSGWIPYYAMKTALPSAVNNADLVREVSPFWFTLKSADKILDLYSPANPSVPMAVPLSTMRVKGFIIIPTITDGTDKLVLAKLLSNEVTRAKIVSSITTLVRVNNFDGIDLDFEGFAFFDGNTTWEKTRPLWVTFIKELSSALKKDGKVLSVTSPVIFDPASTRKGYWVYDWASIAPYIDRLRIMTYDYSTAKPGPIGPLVWSEDAVKYAVSVMPASKVYLGVAGYGRDWVTKVDGVCPSDIAKVITPTAKAATFVMRDALNLIASYGAVSEYKAKEGEVTFSYRKMYLGKLASGADTSCTATRVGWYQDSRSYVARAGLVAKYRLAGIAAWTLGMEEPNAFSAIRTFALTIAPDRVLGSLEISKPEIDYGEAVSILASFTLPDKQPVAGVPVKIEMKKSDGIWREIYSGKTSLDGKISLSVIPSQSLSLRARSDSSWERLEGATTELPILLARRITIKAPAFVMSGREFSITGLITPAEAGITLTIEKLTKKGFELLIFPSAPIMTQSDGTFSILLKGSPEGFSTYRITASSDSRLQGSRAEPFIITVG